MLKLTAISEGLNPLPILTNEQLVVPIKQPVPSRRSALAALRAVEDALGKNEGGITPTLSDAILVLTTFVNTR